ncbi:MAG: stage II sporulation protein E [Clostridiaceae bacterium]|nr:stage II sporulation protein E [Clostridiaceae bacterium]
MQYGIELYPYERINKTNKGKNEKKHIRLRYAFKMSIYFLASFLISRVLLINSTAPFGIAALIAFFSIKEDKLPLFVTGGSLLGYMTLIKNVNEIQIYFIVIVSLLVIRYFIKKIPLKNQLIIMFSLIFLEGIGYNLLIVKINLGASLLIAFVQILVIAPIYFIINYSIKCFKEYKTKHLFSNEELVSMAIGISLIISGTWGISISGISLRSILAIMFILVISYVNGGGVGSAAGIAMGIIIGMTSGNMTVYISIYGLCGLIIGTFKETGKWFSAVSYIVAANILVAYSQFNGEFNLIEAVISCGIFLAIPNKIYNGMELEFNKSIKVENLKDDYVEKIKSILMDRLNDFSSVLLSMSNILYNLADNDKLSLKSKSSSLVENLAERVCSNCDMNNMCWKREMHYTYSAFLELMENFQANKSTIPDELERKCIKKSFLLKHAEEIINNYIISEMWRNRLSEGRELLATQIGNMASSIQEIRSEFNSDIIFNSEIENRVKNILVKNGISVEDCTCIDNKRHRIVVKISMKACNGNQTCVKEMLPLVNAATLKTMCINDEGCRIDMLTKNCLITFEELPKYYVSTFVARQCKDGENYNGDSYFFTKLKDGTHMTIISDGMGSGPQAGQESKAVIDLIESLTEAGFSKITAINTANSIMTLKFSENEKFSTVDLSSIDLYTGEIEFMKVGAVASFIKSGNKVVSINSKTLPIGILDKVDVEINKKRVKNGDLIIMMSDGISDSKSIGQSEWLFQYIKDFENSNPKAMAEGLIEKSKELGGKVKDDMTVLVSKVFSLR